MQVIKNNSPLSLDVVRNKVKRPFNTLIVSPYLQKIATELSTHFIRHIFKFKIDGKELTIEDAMKKGLFNFKVFVERKMKDTEWILITEDNIYYSKGDNSNS